jgi:uncharacterized protein
MMPLALMGTALVVGFLGSWHCGVMCGPLSCNFKKNQDFLSYHLGRLLSYLFIGTCLFYGAHFFLDTDSRIFKAVVSVVFGVIFIFFGLMQLHLFKRQTLFFKYYKFQFKILEKNKNIIKKFPVVLGLLTGLFPCTWLYSFLFFSTQMNTWYEAALIIFIFWFTALPAFIAATGFMQGLIKSAPISHQQISGFILIGAGVFSILGHWV